jgi:DNA-binding CsgD family transcriptional regulator
MNRAQPWTVMRVVKAVPDAALSPLMKLILLEHYGLENTSSGCWMGASRLARRLGLSPNTVKWARTELVKRGLLRHAGGGRGEAVRWYIEVPADCRTAAKPTDEQVAFAAKRLAAYLTGTEEAAANGGGKVGGLGHPLRGDRAAGKWVVLPPTPATKVGGS